jgi:hypothetical protein
VARYFPIVFPILSWYLLRRWRSIWVGTHESAAKKLVGDDFAARRMRQYPSAVIGLHLAMLLYVIAEFGADEAGGFSVGLRLTLLVGGVLILLCGLSTYTTGRYARPALLVPPPHRSRRAGVT